MTITVGSDLAMDSQPTVGHSSSDSITFSMPSLSIRYPGAPLRPATKGSALMLVEENQKTAETSGRLRERARSIASASRSFSSETSSMPLCCTSKIVASRSEEHTSELQSLMRISYAVFCLKQTKQMNQRRDTNTIN